LIERKIPQLLEEQESEQKLFVRLKMIYSQIYFNVSLEYKKPATLCGVSENRVGAGFNDEFAGQC